MRSLYQVLRAAGDVKSAARGPAPLVRRRARAAAHRSLARSLRRVLRP